MLHFHRQHFLIADVGDGIVAQHQHHQGDAKGINIIGEAAPPAAAPCRHGSVDRLKQPRLIETVRYRCAISQRDNLHGFVHKKHVGGIDFPVRVVDCTHGPDAFDQGGHDAAWKIVFIEFVVAGLHRIEDAAALRAFINNELGVLFQ